MFRSITRATKAIHPSSFQKKFFSTSSTRCQRAFDPATTRVGWIGTGVMGKWMCSHLIDKGYKNVTVFNRTPSKAQDLVAKGARFVDSPRRVAQQSDVVFTMVGYPADVRQVILGSDGVLSGLREGSVVVDMTTSQPALAREIFDRAQVKGVHSVDAPVSGGDVGAREARLSIMIGGEQEVVNALHPLFQCMGKNIKYMGPAGSGQHTKMMNQILIASGMVALVEGLLYASKAGLDVEKAIEAVATGAAGSWSLSNYGPRILKGDLAPGFYVNHFIKDMEIALEECQRMGLVLPGLNNAKMLYDSLKAHGHGKLGTHSLILALENLNNTTLKTNKPPLPHP